MPTFINPKRVEVTPRGGSGMAALALLAVLAAVAAGVYWLLADTIFLAVAISVLSVLCVAGTVLIVRELRHPSMGPLWRPARPPEEGVPAPVPALPVAMRLAIEAPKPVLATVVRKDDQEEVIVMSPSYTREQIRSGAGTPDPR